MKVFLTGATGYIGTVLAEQLQQAGQWSLPQLESSLTLYLAANSGKK